MSAFRARGLLPLPECSYQQATNVRQDFNAFFPIGEVMSDVDISRNPSLSLCLASIRVLRL